ncbi:T-complex protein 1 subunit gamma [Thecamonas trahens ATCC 50062]|uniref:T-complex protein 1 subunit gamma n=1 Tax=Thecamonas trahens ATCC 50062 TaxID=461836 RepID=A0A0L0DBV5_THETB|nr:T-complex protein 1 subunit gamma [Thecamonas trahens ATCC 50062]KNC48788.1 T-complex protein 1 subunit gamma [Thecamonas trahens ATCC 50062]|eukprot:XP_013762839.1 T-complex protein 1 subunit gamma [Thecamonas trahens ATCC 50062]
MMPRRQPNVMVFNTNQESEKGRKAQLSNIAAAKAVSDVVRTCLGPRAMLKMILDPMGGIVMTNDGNAILREIDVKHPAAKSMIELSRTQDEEVGDGTTSVAILAGEVMASAELFLERNMHPIVICSAFRRMLDDAVDYMEELSFPIDPNDRPSMMNLIKSCLGTKFSSRWMELMCNLALDAVNTVHLEQDGRTEIDIKRYARVEKIPGGTMEDSRVLSGVMINKDIVHQKMRRRIENPRIILLDCPLEYIKGESKTDIEISGEADFNRILELEDAHVQRLCADLLALKPDIVITEKGCSDLAQHYLMKANVTVIRRLRKTDNNRIARAVGATICHRPEEVKESDVGTGCGLFDIRKIGDDYFSFFVECEAPKAATILLRGASKDVLQEIDRNLQDAMNVARNVVFDPRVVPGGGSIEMALSQALVRKSKSIEGIEQWPYRAAAEALEVIPRTLAQNCGANVIRLMTELRAAHASGDNATMGVNGITGELIDMTTIDIWEPYAVKVQTIKTAVEQATLLLRIDEIVSGLAPQQAGGQQAPQPPAGGPPGGMPMPQ